MDWQDIVRIISAATTLLVLLPLMVLGFRNPGQIAERLRQKLMGWLGLLGFVLFVASLTALGIISRDLMYGDGPAEHVAGVTIRVLTFTCVIGVFYAFWLWVRLPGWKPIARLLHLHLHLREP